MARRKKNASTLTKVIVGGLAVVGAVVVYKVVTADDKKKVTSKKAAELPEKSNQPKKGYSPTQVDKDRLVSLGYSFSEGGIRDFQTDYNAVNRDLEAQDYPVMHQMYIDVDGDLGGQTAEALYSATYLEGELGQTWSEIVG